jgi:hypothetical protein
MLASARAAAEALFWPWVAERLAAHYESALRGHVPASGE